MIAKYFKETIMPSRSRPSFTLLELLAVIAIIGILTGMVMYTLAGAQRDASIAKTQATVRKLNDIMLSRWEEFRYRAVKINIPASFLDPYKLPDGQLQTPVSAREGARIRMIILRDLMRMEFPDRYSDILFTPSRYTVAAYTADNGPPYNDTNNDAALNPPVDRDVPGVYNNFRKRMVVNGSGVPLPITTVPYPGTSGVAALGVLRSGISTAYESAELLYQIVATLNYNGSNGLEYFSPSEIGDFDEDGMPEFIDAWGRPIQWLRWPAGYGLVDSATVQAELGRVPTIQDIEARRPSDWMLNDLSVPDPLDPLHTDWRWSLSKFTQKPWLLVPLIASAGPDGTFDIQFNTTAGVNYAATLWPGPTDSPEHLKSPYYFVDPYVGFYNNASGAGMQGGLGQWQNDDLVYDTYGATDNITNYALILQ